MHYKATCVGLFKYIHVLSTSADKCYFGIHSRGPCLNHLNHLMVHVLSKCYLFKIPNENLKQNRTVLLHVYPHSGITSNLGHTPQHNILRTSFSEKSLGENFPKKVKSKNKMPLQSVAAINVINTASCITLKSEKCRSKAGFTFQPIWVIQGSPKVLHNSAVALLSWWTAMISDQLNAIIKKVITAFVFWLIS